MNRWNIAICDDEEAALSILSSSLQGAFRSHNVEVAIDTYTRPRVMLAQMKSTNYDLLFLDIEMPGLSGIDVAQQLRHDGNLVDIIFISNREDLVFDALRVNPRGFIRKTRFIQDVAGVIDTYFAYRNDKTQEKVLVVRQRDQVLHISLEKLKYIEGSGKKQLAVTVDREEPIEMNKSMQELEEELSGFGFLRIHKGYLVNYRFIRRIGEDEVVLTDDQRLPVSRRKHQEVREQYMEWMQQEGSVML